MSDALERAAAAVWDTLPKRGEPIPDMLGQKVARAVLQALREPDEAMITAGIIERHDTGVPEAWKLATENIWRAMIDAALK